jgi:hypothetical protein
VLELLSILVRPHPCDRHEPKKIRRPSVDTSIDPGSPRNLLYECLDEYTRLVDLVRRDLLADTEHNSLHRGLYQTSDAEEIIHTAACRKPV